VPEATGKPVCLAPDESVPPAGPVDGAVPEPDGAVAGCPGEPDAGGWH
jgi:hypothetical protein